MVQEQLNRLWERLPSADINLPASFTDFEEYALVTHQNETLFGTKRVITEPLYIRGKSNQRGYSDLVAFRQFVSKEGRAARRKGDLLVPMREDCILSYAKIGIED